MLGAVAKSTKVAVAPPDAHGDSNGQTEKKPINQNHTVLKVKKKKSKSTSRSSGNEHCEVDLHVKKKYKLIKRLGKGAYGIVWAALELQTREKVALKQIFDAFQNRQDSQRTYREIFFLLKFGSHPNIISLRNAHRAQNDLDFYITFPLMMSDLHLAVRSMPEKLDKETIRSILYQICKAVLYIHSADVIHRDIKPANVLLDFNLDVKLGDFGLARSMASIDFDATSDGHPEMTDYVATRWYRPPEILFDSKKYTKAIDIWSLACILGEMVQRVPVFAGKTTAEQIQMVMSRIQKPTQLEIVELASESLAPLAISSLQSHDDSIRVLFQDHDPDFVDFMDKIFIFHAHLRPTIHEVLAYPIFQSVRCISGEIRFHRQIYPPINENTRLSTAVYRENIYAMVKSEEFTNTTRHSIDRHLNFPPPSLFREVGGVQTKKIKRKSISALTLLSNDFERNDEFKRIGDTATPALPNVNKKEDADDVRGIAQSEGQVGMAGDFEPNYQEVKAIKRKQRQETLGGSHFESLKSPAKIQSRQQRLLTAPQLTDLSKSNSAVKCRPKSKHRHESFQSNSTSVISTSTISTTKNDKTKNPNSRSFDFKSKMKEMNEKMDSIHLGPKCTDFDVERGVIQKTGRKVDTRFFNRFSLPVITEKVKNHFLPTNLKRERLEEIPRPSTVSASHPDFFTFIDEKRPEFRNRRPWTSVKYSESKMLNSPAHVHPYEADYYRTSQPQQDVKNFVEEDRERPESQGRAQQYSKKRLDFECPTSSTNVGSQRLHGYGDTLPYTNIPSPNARQPRGQLTIIIPSLPQSTHENTRKMPIEKPRDQSRHSTYFHNVEIVDGYRSKIERNVSQRPRITPSINSTIATTTTHQERLPSREKSRSRPQQPHRTYASRPSFATSCQMAKLYAEPRLRPFENYTQGHATISSKELNALRETFARVSQY